MALGTIKGHITRYLASRCQGELRSPAEGRIIFIKGLPTAWGSLEDDTAHGPQAVNNRNLSPMKAVMRAVAADACCSWS